MSHTTISDCSINLLIISETKENLIMQKEDQRFKNLNVIKTMKMLFVSTSANITSEPSSDTYSHL